MRKIIFLLSLIVVLASGCQKQRCYNCPHGINATTYVTVCSDDWGPTLGNSGTWQTPANQTYVNYSNCY